MRKGFKIIKDNLNHVVIEKIDESIPWFNHDCSDENLLKEIDRTDREVDQVKWQDGKYIASELNIFLKP